MKKLFILLLAIVTLTIADTGVARANVQNFVINNFDATYRLTDDDPQGKLYIEERIDVTFSSNNHGILRALPQKYKGQKLNVTPTTVLKADGSSWSYTTYEQNGNLVLKIGDPNRTVTGPNTFVVSYSVENVISFYDGYHELFWDINGDQWKQEFQKVKATIILPDGMVSDQQKCFTGRFGSTAQNCQIQNDGKQIVFSTSQPLKGFETLSVVVAIPQGAFTPPTFKDWLSDNFVFVIGLLVPPLITGYASFRYWHVKGRDPKGKGVIVPEYEPPDNLKPIEVGAIVDYSVDNKDISATIIDLAVHGYMVLHQNKKKKLLGSHNDYEFERTSKSGSGLKSFEQDILKGIFGSVEASGKHVKLSSLKTKFYTTAQRVRDVVLDDLSRQGYFDGHPQKARSKMMVIAFVIAVLAAVSIGLSWGFVFGLGISAAIVFLFALIMPKRLEAGVVAKDHIDGLKLYLSTAEADRIKFHQGPSTSHLKDEPTRTVDLFEKLLPYAILLNVEKQWAKQFAEIYTTPPDWYSGNVAAFTTANLVSDLDSSISAMGANFSPPQSSSGSGFSGGGSSGGGGGGGGGGGW